MINIYMLVNARADADQTTVCQLFVVFKTIYFCMFHVSLL